MSLKNYNLHKKISNTSKEKYLGATFSNELQYEICFPWSEIKKNKANDVLRKV